MHHDPCFHFLSGICRCRRSHVLLQGSLTTLASAYPARLCKAITSAALRGFVPTRAHGVLRLILSIHKLTMRVLLKTLCLHMLALGPSTTSCRCRKVCIGSVSERCISLALRTLTYSNRSRSVYLYVVVLVGLVFFVATRLAD